MSGAKSAKKYVTSDEDNDSDESSVRSPPSLNVPMETVDRAKLSSSHPHVQIVSPDGTTNHVQRTESKLSMNEEEGAGARVLPRQRTLVDVFEDRDGIIALNDKLGAVSAYSTTDLLILRSWMCGLTQYALFILLFSIVAFSSDAGEQAFYQTDAVKDSLVNDRFFVDAGEETFASISKTSEVFLWLRGPFLDSLFVTTYYNGEEVAVEDERLVLDNSRVMGSIRLRQKRVVPNVNCRVPPSVTVYYPTCVGAYDDIMEDKESFGNDTMYQYQATSEYWSHLARLESYAPGGYIVDLSGNRSEAISYINRIEAERWIDKHTRALFIEFSLYNGNLNLFTVCRLVVEFTPSGAVVTSWVIRTLKLLRYSFPSDYVRMALEILLMLFVLWFIALEIQSLYKAFFFEKRGWKAYFVDDKWHYLDVVNLFVFCVICVMRVFSTARIRKIIASDTFQEGTSYIELQDAAFIQQNEQYLNALNMLFCWIKTFRHIGDLPRIGQLVKTLVNAAFDTILFIIMFTFVFAGYSQCAYLMFSSDLHEFRTMVATFQTMFRFIVGDFDYASIASSNRFLGPLFFFSYMVLVFFVLLNMFIAIINNAYEVVRRNEAHLIDNKNKEAKIRAFLFPDSSPTSSWGHLKAFLSMVRAALSAKREESLIELVESGKIDEDGDGHMSRDELKKKLPANFDIDGLMLKYDTDKSGTLDTREVVRWLKDLNAEKIELESLLSLLVESKLQGAHVDESEEEELKSRVMLYLSKVKERVPGDSDLLRLHYRREMNANILPLPGQVTSLTRKASVALKSLHGGSERGSLASSRGQGQRGLMHDKDAALHGQLAEKDRDRSSEEMLTKVLVRLEQAEERAEAQTRALNAQLHLITELTNKAKVPHELLAPSVAKA